MMMTTMLVRHEGLVLNGESCACCCPASGCGILYHSHVPAVFIVLLWSSHLLRSHSSG
jgi:hypothetical protein